MTWWRRKRTQPSPETSEARRKLEEARADLAAARADNEPVEAVAQQLQELRNRNHFGPMITAALRGSR